MGAGPKSKIDGVDESIIPFGGLYLNEDPYPDGPDKSNFPFGELGWNQDIPEVPEPPPVVVVDGDGESTFFPCVPLRLREGLINPDAENKSSGLGSNDAGTEPSINAADQSESPGGGLNVNEEPVVADGGTPASAFPRDRV
jgi:hypothetical protein